MGNKIFNSTLSGLKQFFGPNLSVASWKILAAMGVFVLLSLTPSFSQGTWFCGDFGYPFIYAEGFGPCKYNSICQDFYLDNLIYLIVFSYVVSCFLITFLPILITKIKSIKLNKNLLHKKVSKK